MVKFYYDQIKKADSNESDVDNFYNNMLDLYFPKDKLYGIEQKSRPLKELGLTKETDFTIRCIRKANLKKLLSSNSSAKF